jgi:hypothetical protein
MDFSLQNLVDSADWLMKLLADSHALVRTHARHCLVSLAHQRAVAFVSPLERKGGVAAAPVVLDQSANAQFTVHLQRIVLECHKLLMDEYQSHNTSSSSSAGASTAVHPGALLRRRKADRLYLFARLARYTHTTTVRAELVPILIR